MEAHNQYTDSVQQAATVPANAAETVCIILPGISVAVGVGVVLEAAVSFTTGASTTAVTARIRRGITTAGALVGGAFALTIGAAALAALSPQVQDTQQVDLAGQQYCLTLQQTAGAANGSALFASLQASWIQ